MIGRLIGLIGMIATMLTVLVMGTLIAAVVMLGIIWFRWDMNSKKVEQIVAIAQGYDLAAMREESEQLRQAVPTEQVSFSQVIEGRVMRDRDIELREQALGQGIEELRFKQRKQVEDLRHFDQVRQEFETRLAKMTNTGVSTGLQENIIMIQNMKPSQAKDQLVQMYDNGEIDAVVRLMAGMNPSKRKRITGEYKDDKDKQQLGEILRRIREGYPLAAIAGETQEALEKTAPAQP